MNTIDSYIIENCCFYIIFIDLDDFKMFNDIKGHEFGDLILIKVASILTNIKNKHKFITRYGGDEFIILYKSNDKKSDEEFIKTIYKEFNNPISIYDQPCNIQFSMGISSYPINGNNSSELIRKADLAMYEAKNSGKNHYKFYMSKMDKVLKEEVKIKELLEKSISNNEFKILIQPQVDLKSNKIISYEALARINNQTIGPDKFIKIAEKYNLINKVGIIIIDQTIETLVKFKELGLKLKTIYVNLSINQLSDEHLIDYISSKLLEHKISNEYLGIEITENASNNFQKISLLI